MRIAFVSIATPHARSSWSGIPWYALRALQGAGHDVTVVTTPRLDALAERFRRAEWLGFPIKRHPWLVNVYARRIDAQLAAIRPDAVVAISAAHKIARSRPDFPVVYATDAMFASMADYYRHYSARSGLQLRYGNSAQHDLIERVDRFAMASKWGMDDAVRRYGMPADRAVIVPMGANLDVDPGFQPVDRSAPLTLLFVGYNWARKRGELVLAAWRILRERTGNAELHIVGADPASARGLAGVTVHGRLNKMDEGDYRRLSALYARSHFFFMPSEREAYGIVYCEAAAFGRPAIATATGGVSTIVDHGRTGLLLDELAGPEAYAEQILALWNRPDDHLAMCHAARARYETVLNWQAWAGRITTLAEEAIAERAARP
ncbi:glycosyltransferase family 4 protein [Sphingomonas sp. FW199]|uniref:glycosyltransferase family 4 protein n=1 Tax=Sphingomonas sp. FW199 TaxID=3400217 RepID=UPI003CEE974A